MKVTKKEIKGFNAIDITYSTQDEIIKLKEREGYFNEIAYSQGLYGCNGCVIQGNNTKQLYKVTSRTSTLLMIW